MSLKLPGLVSIDYVWQSPLRRVPPPARTRTVILSAGAKARLARIVRRAPEVVVKVKGRTRSGGHLRAHLRYRRPSEAQQRMEPTRPRGLSEPDPQKPRDRSR